MATTTLTIDRSRTALLSIDLVRDVAAPGGRLVPDEPEALERFAAAFERVQRAQRAAREGGVPVIHARTAYAAGYPALNLSTPTGQLIALKQALREGEAGSEFVEGAGPIGSEWVVTKRMMSAFCGTDLDAILRSARIDTIACVGFVTHMAVEATAREAADRGYRVIVVHDACASAGVHRHTAALDVLGRLTALVSTDDWCAALAPVISSEEAEASGSSEESAEGV